ncbi:MAG: S-methyl-5'-thioadenosine phosphorylase [Proteobacteria bacterium]|nr:S-methyl-5'-thioadenosine phosphorylase [Pseudomonadota bacterium]
MKFGIIGGSGLYDIEGLSNVELRTIDTPFGDPSDQFLTGKMDGKEVVFLPRHGRGHRLLPLEINNRANIWAMKSLGVTHLISVSAVGSLKEEIAPGHIVVPDQFIDRTKDRPSTFFGDGVVAHLIFGKPVCSELIRSISEAAQKAGVVFHQGGTYVCIEGPIFSTRAESEMFRSFGGSIVGMTNLQEAKLAREAEICFATIALTTDYDSWHKSVEEITIETILEVMNQNIANAKTVLKILFETFTPAEPPCPDRSALKGTILTKPDLIPDETRKKLSLLIDKYLPA